MVKEKSSIIDYECEKSGPFKLECPDLEKSQDKKKFIKTKDEKRLMSTWEDLDDTPSDEDDEEANICLMANTTSEGSKLDQDDEVNFDDLESLKKAYHELLSSSLIL